MILSASRRTDIPCYYGDWLVNRLKQGNVWVRNPMNSGQISEIPLGTDVVDCIVFWTKDPQRFLPCLDTIDRMGYSYYFQFTLTPYGKQIEPNLRDKAGIVETFQTLSRRIGKERVQWRYDPILFNERIGIGYHKELFQRMCETLSPYTETVIISFVDMYSRLRTPLVRPLRPEEMYELAEMIGKTAENYGIVPKSCCEEDLSAYGIRKASCIDKETLEKICGYPLELRRDRGQRKNCGCVESVDIGAYHTCPNGCVYCYANHGQSAVQKNFLFHDPNSPFLCGGLKPGERPVQRGGKSHKSEQISLWEGRRENGN